MSKCLGGTSRVSPQMQTGGGLSSALSFKNRSQALNIYYLPPSLRCGAAQSSEHTACCSPRPPKSLQRFHRGATNCKVYLAAAKAWSQWTHSRFKHFALLQLDHLGKKQSPVLLFKRCWMRFLLPLPAPPPYDHSSEANLTFSRENVKSIQKCSSLQLLLYFFNYKYTVPYIQFCFFLICFTHSWVRIGQ